MITKGAIVASLTPKCVWYAYSKIVTQSVINTVQRDLVHSDKIKRSVVFLSSVSYFI